MEADATLPDAPGLTGQSIHRILAKRRPADPPLPCRLAHPGSIEEQAFHHRPSLIIDADLVEDDVPRNADFLDDHQGPRSPPLSKPSSALEAVSLEAASQGAAVPSESDGETIELLHPFGLAPVEDYAATLAQQPTAPLCVRPSTETVSQPPSD